MPEVANSKRMYFSFAQKTLSFLIQHKLPEVSGPRNLFFIHDAFFNCWPPALHVLLSDRYFFFSRFSAYRAISKNCSTSLFPAENEDFYGQVSVVVVIFLR